MATEYTIYLVNNSLNKRNFWCFLARPEELEGDPNVFANSSTNLVVTSKASSQNKFTIPVQYVAGGGSSNRAVGSKIKVISTITTNAELKDTWEIDYTTMDDKCVSKEGPDMKKLSDQKAPDGQISLKSNPFNQEQNENCKWFSSMSFGIQTQDGFIGMTWAPSPSVTRTLTPKLTFYVTTGEFGSNELASWTEISNDAAVIKVPDNFQNLETTVILTEDGKWKIIAGAPKTTFSAASSGLIENLINSHRSLLAGMTELWGLVKGQGGANLLLSDNLLSDSDTSPAPNVAIKNEAGTGVISTGYVKYLPLSIPFTVVNLNHPELIQVNYEYQVVANNDPNHPIGCMCRTKGNTTAIFE